VSTPGDLRRLRFGSFYRARAAADHWDYLVSFDGVRFTAVDRAAGPTVGDERFVTFDRVPTGARQAWIRFAGHRADTLMMFDFRIDADYAEPAGGFAPVAVTYAWDEDGQPQRQTHVATSASDDWAIHCGKTPHMRQLVLERQ
jgi:hypothetical protein